MDEPMIYSSMSVGNEETSDTDEFALRQNMLFSDSLKGLKMMRSQLYSAAEYFEVSYDSDDQHIMMNTLKDYTIKALVNAVDHLGSVSRKVNGFIVQEVDEVTDAELRVCCIEQRLRTCQESIDVEGRSQQALVIKTPRFHKHYISKGETVQELGKQPVNYQEYIPSKDDNRPQQFPNVKRLSTCGRPSAAKIVHSTSPSRSASSSPLQRAWSLTPSFKSQPLSPSTQIGAVFPKDKRTVTPLSPSKSFSQAELPTSQNLKPFLRAGSPNSRISEPLTRIGSPPLRQIIPNPSKFLPQRQNSASSLDGKKNNHTRGNENQTKSRGFLKALLTRRRSKNDELLYSYLDEY